LRLYGLLHEIIIIIITRFISHVKSFTKKLLKKKIILKKIIEGRVRGKPTREFKTNSNAT